MEIVPSHCPVCPVASSAPVAQGVDFEYETTGTTEWVFQKCLECGTLFLSPRPSESEFTRIYPSHYYSYDFSEKRSLGYRVKARLDKLSARTYLRLMKQPGPILDIGCGDGRLLNAFASQGIDRKLLFGVEVDSKAAEKAQARGFSVQSGGFEDAVFPERFFSLVLFQQVLEHLPDPNAALQKIRKHLAPGGVVIVETPNTKAWDAHLFGKRYWGGYHIPRHFFLFQPHAVTQLFEKNEMKVVKIQFLLSPSFWVQSVHHMLKEKKAPQFLCRFFRPHPANAFALGIFSTIDLFGKLFKMTSNMRIVVTRE